MVLFFSSNVIIYSIIEEEIDTTDRDDRQIIDRGNRQDILDGYNEDNRQR